MIIAIHQPNYIPWLGFFHKMSLCDKFVLLDNVPFSKNGYQNRCKIKTDQGVKWLTVPVFTKGHFGQSTHQVQIDSKGGWADKHWRTLQQNYGHAPFFHSVAQQIERVYQSPWDLLVDPNIEFIGKIAQMLGITTTLIRATQLDIKGSRSELLCSICQTLGATEYLSGPSGKGYLDEQVFSEKGIRVCYHQFSHPPYLQMYGAFVPGLSVLDLLANCGASSRDIMLGHTCPPVT